MIPLGDDLPTLRRPVMTYAIIAVTLAVWILVQKAGAIPLDLAKSVCDFGLVPAELTHLRPVGFGVPIGQGLSCLIDASAINAWTPLLSIFLHGSWGHILGNMLYLWIFGNNIEDSMGSARFVAFYLLCGLAAAGAHVLVDPASPVPTVGASGAISGVMGAYVILYPQARVRLFFPPLFFFRVRAWLVLLFWFGMQVLQGLPQLNRMNPDVSGGVAVWAHVGGFIAGLVLIKLFADRQLVAAHRATHGHWYGRE